MAHCVKFEIVDTVVHGVDEARLVFVDDKLGAVVVKLGDAFGDLAHSWHAEAAFNGLERMSEKTFPSLRAIEDWIKRTRDE